MAFQGDNSSSFKEIRVPAVVTISHIILMRGRLVRSRRRSLGKDRCARVFRQKLAHLSTRGGLIQKTKGHTKQVLYSYFSHPSVGRGLFLTYQLALALGHETNSPDHQTSARVRKCSGQCSLSGPALCQTRSVQESNMRYSRT